MLKLAFDVRNIAEDVGMIKLQVIQNRRPGSIVNELRALVEEGRIVFVRFDDEQRRIGQAC